MYDVKNFQQLLKERFHIFVKQNFDAARSLYGIGRYIYEIIKITFKEEQI